MEIRVSLMKLYVIAQNCFTVMVNLNNANANLGMIFTITLVVNKYFDKINASKGLK
jgi:hypothetical protein